MSATTIRAAIVASLAVVAFILIIQMLDDNRRPPGPAAFCDVRTMNCYARLGSAR